MKTCKDCPWYYYREIDRNPDREARLERGDAWDADKFEIIYGCRKGYNQPEPPQPDTAICPEFVEEPPHDR